CAGRFVSRPGEGLTTTSRKRAQKAALRTRNAFRLHRIRFTGPTSFSRLDMTAGAEDLLHEKPGSSLGTGSMPRENGSGAARRVDAAPSRRSVCHESATNPLTAAGSPTRMGVLHPQFLSPP